MKVEASAGNSAASIADKKTIRYYLSRDKYLLLFMLPGLLYFILFQYLPMLGLVIAFQDYSPFLGMLHSKWVGFAHFKELLIYPEFWRLMRNTLLISLYRIVFFFPAPILLSLLLNEVRRQFMKRFVQTIVYLPHFLSWVVVAGISFAFLSPQTGFVNLLIGKMGFSPVDFIHSEGTFRGMLVAQGIWKETGWGTVLFLAALSGVNQELYEAAKMDGASRVRQIWHISLPALASTAIVLLIIRIGHILDAGFEQVFIMYNPMVYDVGDIIDTFVYRQGIVEGDFSFVTAVGFFKSAVGIALVILANKLSKRVTGESVY